VTASVQNDLSSTELTSPHRLGVIVVGAGDGTRLNAGIPKAFVQLGEKSLMQRAIETVVSLPGPGHLVAVVPDARAAEVLGLLEQATQTAGASCGTNIALGGAERHLSVQNGLEMMPEWVETVLVHDAARPLAPASLFQRVAHAVRERNASVVPVMQVTDTVKRLNAAGDVEETLDRSLLALAQTPQGFPREALVAAYERVNSAHTDDAAVVQAAGFTVTTVGGSERALKLTTAADLRLLEWMLIQDRELDS